MKQNELRQKVPETAAFLDAICAAFGMKAVHEQVRRGLAGEPVFYARENGIEIGTRRPPNTPLIAIDPATAGQAGRQTNRR